jgi:hypothetical protein
LRKNVAHGTRPARPVRLPVSIASTEPEPLKRLTIDIRRSLHARIKSQCALRGTKMVEEIRLLLERAYPDAG